MTFRQAIMTSIVLSIYLAFSAAFAANFTGVPRIVDGDTLAIGAIKFRLEGIDAPETDQVCLNANGARWTCGIDARDQLGFLGGGQKRTSPDSITSSARVSTAGGKLAPNPPKNQNAPNAGLL